MFLFKSITRRIILLHFVAILVTSAFIPVALYLLLKSSAEDLLHRSLRDTASLVTQHMTERPDGTLALDLPQGLNSLFSEAYGRYVYSIADESGQVLFSSLAGREPVFDTGTRSQAPQYLERQRAGVLLSGTSVPTQIGSRTVWIQVAQDLEHRDVLIDDIVREFFGRVGWITIPILLSLLIIDVSIFRGALSPLLRASQLAEQIGPERTDVRLPLEGMPSEIKPLVGTINRALDRLERGILVQRDFTADAAHELRTPLSILQARVDNIADRNSAKELGRDIDRMKRVVSQLLDIAELDGFALASTDEADLKEVCVDVAEYIAPLAIAEGKHICFEAPETPVLIRGNSEVLFRAFRNLAENAIRHTPKGTTVHIIVNSYGSVSVCDEGPGIPKAEREQIFQRFWRKDRTGSTGSGLGLSIVKRIADTHDAEITVSNLYPGSCFTLKFKGDPSLAQSDTMESMPL